MKEIAVKLFVVGDVVFNNKFFGKEEEWIAEFPFESCRYSVQGADISILNLEGPLSVRGHAVKHKSSLRSEPYWFMGMKSTGFNVFNLANNHIFDYGLEAIEDTVNLIEENGLKYVGYGKNLVDANRPLILIVKGVKIAILSYCTVINKAHLYADEVNPGIPRADIPTIEETVRAAKAHVDIVIVLCHWGLENYLYPTPEQRLIGHAAIDAGASLVIGHHPHVVQGVESYNNGIIAYSLGNFIFSDIYWEGTSPTGDNFIFEKKWTGNNLKSIAFDCILSKRGVESYNIHYYRTADNLLPVKDQTMSRKLEFEKQSLAISNNYLLNWKLFSFKKELSETIGIVVKHTVKLLTKPHKLRLHHIKYIKNRILVSLLVVRGRNAR